MSDPKQSPDGKLPNDFAQDGAPAGSFGNYGAKDGARVPNLPGNAGNDPIQPNNRGNQGRG